MDEVFRVVKPLFLALAFCGALIALSFWPPTTRAKLVANVFIGTMISATTVPAISVVIEYFFPSFPQSIFIVGPAYFWCGLLGMKLVPVAARLVDRLKSLKIPGVEE